MPNGAGPIWSFLLPLLPLGIGIVFVHVRAAISQCVVHLSERGIVVRRAELASLLESF